jgi:hypothetical protein
MKQHQHDESDSNNGDIGNFNNHTVINPAHRGGDVENEYEYYQDANEVMRGSVTLLSSNQGPQSVILSVFKTSVDHFALVYPDNRRKAVAVKPVGCINVRGVTCEETILGSGIRGFTLRPKKCDTSSAALIFVCQEETNSSSASISQWIQAFAPASANLLNKRNIPKQCSLPSVEEEE